MELTRRGLMAGSSAVLLAGAAPQPFFRRRRLPIGLQLYSVGAELRRDFEGTLKAVSAIGYRTVETAGYAGRSPKDLRAAFDANRLECTSAHVQARGKGPEPTLSGDLGALAADMHVLGARHVVMPSFLAPEAGRGAELTAEDWKATADFLNRTGAGLKREGLQLGYHNHNPEFAPLAGGTGLDLLLKATDPALVQFEMDAGWVVAGGHDPLALLRAHPGRFTQMHVKDVARGVEPNYAFHVRTTSVGDGVIDWPRLLAGAYAEGVREYFVEHEPPFTRPVLEMLKASYDNLAAMPGAA
ncbi:MAG TPA: sugar phosphate isomerase/epimerase [Phenylobacterium sp.]|nr:sugar phosphate isomerase/epimerase [Phenylobacterium sp.]